MQYYKRLRDLREDNDLKQEDIAKILNITKQAYGRYENGARKLSIEDLIKLCNFYNVSADYIIGRTDNPETNKSTTNIKYQINGGKFNKTTMKWGKKMESSIIESSVNLQEVLADSMINGFLATVIQIMFFSPVSILVYGGIAILILRFIWAKIRKRKGK